MDVQQEVDRFLTLLGSKIRERGFTQLEVQEALGWGRSYISQLLTRQKALRIEQVLLILGVIGTPAVEFFAELYPLPPAATAVGHQPAEMAESVAKLHCLLTSTLDLLVEKKLIAAEDLPAATRPMAEESGPAAPARWDAMAGNKWPEPPPS